MAEMPSIQKTESGPNKQGRERFCAYCGDSLGWIPDRNYDRGDTCGKRECQRWEQDEARADREEAHERLDRDMGWD